MSLLRQIKHLFWAEILISLLLCIICLTLTFWVWLSISNQPIWMINIGQNQYLIDVDWINTNWILIVGIAISLALSACIYWTLSARQRMLAQLIQTHEKLAKAVQQNRPLERIANNTFHNVIITNAEGTIEWVNAGFLQSMGYALHTTVGKRYMSLRIGPKTQEATVASIHAHMIDGKSFQCELMLYDRERKAHWLAIDIQPIHNDKGQIEQFVCIERNITSNKVIANTLQSHDRKLDFVMHAAHIGMWEIIPDTEFLVVNDPWMQMLGYDASHPNFKRTQVQSWMHPDDHDCVVNAMEAYWHGDAPAFEAEFRMMDAHGTYRWFYTMGDVLTNDTNGEQEKRMVGVLVDIDATKRTSIELQESEQRLRMISDSTRDGVIMLDHQDRIIHWNPSAERLFGQKQSQVLGQCFHDNLIESPHNLQEQLTAISDTDGSRTNHLFELKIRHPRGFTIPVEASYSFIETQNGRWTVVIFRDITERLEMHKALRESEALFHNVADNVPALIWMSDAQGWITFFNKRWEDFTGRPVKADIGRGWEEIVHPSDKQGLLCAFDRAVEQQIFLRHEYRMKHHSGEYRWILDEGHPHYADDGTYLGLIGSSTDITTERAIREQLMRARDAAESATRAKSEFLANMSHEIRTPMTSILGYTDILKTAGDNSTLKHECIQTVERNGKHLMSIINDILDLSRIEMGKLTLEHVDCCLPDLLHETTTFMKNSASQKELDLRCHYTDDLPKTIQTDPTRLRQILMNLLSNAIKFTYRGHIEVRTRCTMTLADLTSDTLSTTNSDNNATLEISVRDTGIGMSASQLQKLFEPFHQGDSSMSRRFGGTGLGLAISQKLANILGGKIVCTSTQNQGTTFTLSLPVYIHPNSANETTTPAAYQTNIETYTQESEIQSETSSAQSGQRVSGCLLADAHILLVEDGIDNRRLICFFLERAGAKVDTAENGKEACDLLLHTEQPKTYDTILMDMQMPEMDGYEATQKLRASGIETPIIALTAHAMTGDRERCLEAGCNEYMSKPISPSDLIKLIAHHKNKTRNH